MRTRSRYFNPRAPCGARHIVRHGLVLCFQFQSTRPMRGATSLSNRNAWANSAISIHAPRAGRDSSRRGRVCISLNFNPRAPCGARLLIVPQIRSPVYFNPRAPCGARPRSRVHIPPQSYFNPRAPCGARPDTWRSSTPRRKFQSTRPVRGATVSATVTADQINISIHAPRAGRDGLRPGGGPHRNDFNPRAPCGARQFPRVVKS